MLSRDITLPIRSLRLKSCYRFEEPNDITELIIAAMQRRTETFELNMLFNTFDMKLASNIFTCRTLTVLKINGLSIMDDIPKINNNISLIKTLHLDGVHSPNHRHIINLLLSFPILEELQTNNVYAFIHVPKTTADKIKRLPNLVKLFLSSCFPRHKVSV